MSCGKEHVGDRRAASWAEITQRRTSAPVRVALRLFFLQPYPVVCCAAPQLNDRTVCYYVCYSLEGRFFLRRDLHNTETCKGMRSCRLKQSQLLHELFPSPGGLMSWRLRPSSCM